MPKKPLPPEVVELIKKYQEAQVTLINIIATQEARGNVTTYRKAILTSVNQELATLNKYAEGWAKNVIPKAYKTGAEATYSAFRKANINVGKVRVNDKVVNSLVKNVIGQLEDATEFVGRRLADDIRQAGVEAIANKLTTGSTVKQAKQNLLTKLTDKGVTAIRDKNGREIRLDSYAYMVARTTTREATNRAAVQTMEDLGGDLVQISQHFSTCPICAVYEGRVYSISGKSKEYPPLDTAFSGGYSTIHPNCAHVAVPYFPEFDDNAEKTKEDSNKPFELDPAKKKSIDAYNRNQAIKTKLREDRAEWQKARIVAPKDAPKTLSAYKSLKKTENPKYLTIRDKVKSYNIYQEAVKQEPIISNFVKDMAKKNGMDMAGFEFRIKTPSSIALKIKNGVDLSEMKDLIRYTYTANPTELTQKTVDVIKAYRDEGYDIYIVKNTWRSGRLNPYRGINTNVRSPNGQVFELQFHTPESYSMKDKIHKIYDELKEITDKTSPKALELQELMYQQTLPLKMPLNVDKIKNIRGE